MKKRTPEQLEKQAVKILSVLKREGPMVAEAICTATKLPIELMTLPLKKLRASKRVKRVGKGKTRAQQYAAR